MSLKDRIEKDISRTFMREDQFATTHFWNGQKIVCVVDEEESLKRKNNNVNDISWDNNARQKLVHTPLKGFPGGKEPEPNTQIVFDKKPMFVLEVLNNMGLLDIWLIARDAREF
ncbi:hypothetical protein [Porcincola intestinalis]|uniref:Uncharacterized protein n=1 Tax=Porcincola intestinalis TaxID=2606632 RepID=A0A6L5X6X1_9FIRM|nr:hypothetical protein [Porcincola intestinalis]MSS16109.1 hypothetical protein [Porcincola intestinalis]